MEDFENYMEAIALGDVDPENVVYIDPDDPQALWQLQQEGDMKFALSLPLSKLIDTVERDSCDIYCIVF